MIHLQKQLSRWTTFFISIPMCSLLLGINLALWIFLRATHSQYLEKMNAEVLNILEYRLSTETMRLRSMGSTPGAVAIMMASARTRKNEMLERASRADEFERQWASATRDDMHVREVLDNTVSESYRRITSREETVEGIVLTDALGTVMAASEKTARYFLNREDWWIQARQQGGDRIVSEGMSEEGRLGLAFSVWNVSNTNFLMGVLRERLNVKKMVADLIPSISSKNSAVLLLGSKTLYVSGAEDVATRFSTELSMVFREGTRKLGWRKGLRYYGRTLDAGIEWGQPVWVVAIQREGFFPLQRYWPLLASILISLTVAGFWPKAFRRAITQTLLDPYEELLTAGDWALRTAFNRSHKLISKKYTEEHAKAKLGTREDIHHDLDGWLYGLEQDFRDEMAAHSHEIERDLKLAKDFQQAYISKPYPKIPEVHIEGRLRITFYHQYEPALALGGDFFDIFQLAQDCAGVFIADVMGHGTRSALITAILRTLIDDLKKSGRNPRHFLTEINKQVCGLLRNVPNPLFTSAFYFVADTTARVATFSSAGHPAPFAVHRDMGRISRLEVPSPRGAALGVIPNETYSGSQCRMNDGDLFVFFTDGVYEAHNVKGEEFGIERMEASLKENMYKSSKDIIDNMIKSLMDFTAGEPVADDICIVAVDVTTKAESTEADAKKTT